MLKLNVGDKVRSYDFPSTKECYFEGIIQIINKDEGTFVCEPTKQVWEGKSLEFYIKKFTAVLPGEFWLDDQWSNRIELV
jgi:hypothetical protein